MVSKLEQVTAKTCYQQDEPLVGVFVKSLDGHSNHVGFVFFFERKDNGAVVESGTRRLDFMTNEMVIFRALSEKDKGLFHAAMELDSEDSKLLAGYLSAVIMKNGKEPPILYGMRWNGERDCFDANGNYISPKSLDGLSCATFMDVLIDKGLGGPAVEWGDWPENNDQDVAWRQQKLAEYRDRLARGRTKVTQEQISAMEAIDPFKRLRPEQIAAAALADPEMWPMKFDAVRKLAEDVLNDFASCSS